MGLGLVDAPHPDVEGFRLIHNIGRGLVPMKRDEVIDQMKGIAIILMVVCHTDFEHYWWFRRFVHQFHVPIFLMTFSPAKVSDLKRFVGYCAGKVRHIWLPFVIASTICLAAYPLMFA